MASPTAPIEPTVGPSADHLIASDASIDADCSHVSDKQTDVLPCRNVSPPVSSASKLIDRKQILLQYPLLVSFFASNLVYLVTLLSLRTCHRSRKRHLSLNIAHGFISAVVSVLATRPLFVAKTRLQEQKCTNSHCASCQKKSSKQIVSDNNMLREMMLICENQGLSGLWSGCASSLFVASINSPVQTIVYDALQRQLAQTGERTQEASMAQLATLISMMIFSRCTATAVTYPLSLAQARQRLFDVNSSSLLANLRQIVAEQGPLGLFRGIESKLLQTSLLGALLAFTHPRIILYILKLKRSSLTRRSK